MFSLPIRARLRFSCTMLLLGCEIAKILLNIFIGCINGRLACLSVYRKPDQAAFSNYRCSPLFFFFVFVGIITRHYLCDFFVIGQLPIAQPVIGIVFGKAAIFHCGLQWA